MLLSVSYFINKIKCLDLKGNYWFEVRMSLPVIDRINFKLVCSFENPILTNYAHRKLFFFLPSLYFVEMEMKRQLLQRQSTRLPDPLLLYPFLLGFVFFTLFLPFLFLYPTLGSPSFVSTSVMLYVFNLHLEHFLWFQDESTLDMFWGKLMKSFIFYKLMRERNESMNAYKTDY